MKKDKNSNLLSLFIKNSLNKVTKEIDSSLNKSKNSNYEDKE